MDAKKSLGLLNYRLTPENVWPALDAFPLFLKNRPCDRAASGLGIQVCLLWSYQKNIAL